jgi:flavin reductase (DIM6/NTAB) family NADH-FMN oxidoreductase RutF
LSIGSFLVFGLLYPVSLHPPSAGALDQAWPWPSWYGKAVQDPFSVENEVMQDAGFAPLTDARAFRNALGRFATGVCVITAAGPDGPAGFTANSFAALSLDPPLVLWSPAKSSARFAIFGGAPAFSIHVLAQDQSALAARFIRGGAGFAGLDHRVPANGVPQIAGCLARFDCTLHATHDGGDHVIVVGYVHHAMCQDGAPLVFSQGGYGAFVPAT